MKVARTTSIPLVLALIVLGGAIGWSGVALIQAVTGTPPMAPWSAAAGLGFFAALLFAGAWYMYDRVHRGRPSQDRVGAGGGPGAGLGSGTPEPGRGARPGELGRNGPVAGGSSPGGRPRRPVDPLLAVRLLVLGKASALVGAIVGGGYLGFALRFVGDYGVPEYRTRVLSGGAAGLAGIAVLVAALLLERACKVPGPPPGSEDDELERHPSR